MATFIALLLHDGAHSFFSRLAPDDFVTHGPYIVLGFAGGGALVLAVQRFRGRYK